MKSWTSSSTEPMPAMLKVSTRTLATLGERKAGNVGPRWMFLTPRIEQCEQDDDGLLFVPGDVVGDWQLVDVIQTEDFLEFQGDDASE